jgi:hypothetical protein
MELQILPTRTRFPGLFFLALLTPVFLVAQNPAGTLQGQVSDPSGAAVPSASVMAISSSGQIKAGVVHTDGSYEIKGLAPGAYTVRAHARGFGTFEQQNVRMIAGQSRKVDIALKIAQQVEKVEVTDQTTQVSVNPRENANSIVIKGQDLQALSDDPDELQAELQALAGPSAGPNGGQIYIDGFTAGQLPPKADILEIRINRDPFSAESDRLGYGRIEITTRPGTSQFHGQLMGDFNLSAFNTRNPFAAQEPGYHTDFFSGSLGGPLSKRASFFFTIFRRDIGDDSIVSAVVLGPAPTYTPTASSQAVPSPHKMTNLGPRGDLQLSTNNVLSVRYQFFDISAINGGIGQLNLASQGINTHSLEHALQFSDTEVFSAKTLNRFRFQYLRDDVTSTAQHFSPTISVLGAFIGGGNSSGTSTDKQNRFEVQNLTSFFLGKHTLQVGGRLRDAQDDNSTDANFNGTFTFTSLAAYQTAEQTLETCSSAGGTNCQVSGANQFLVMAGNPLISLNLLDVGLFLHDDWQVHSGMTLSLGLRWESQTGIPDHSDFAPRLGFAWGLNRHKNAPAKTVLRAGFGVFYDRFPESLLLQSERLNGTNQQMFLVPSPAFYPDIPSLSSLTSDTATPTRYEVDPSFRAPYVIQSAIGVEQQVTRNAKLSVSYLNSHGVHQLFANDINAPLPGTFPLGQPQVGTRPFGNGAGNIYDYQSGGLFNQAQLIANLNVRLSSNLSLMGYYTLGYANANTNGNNAALIMNPYDIAQDYGRAPFDVRNRVRLFGTWNLPHRLSFSPFIVASSGRPLNVTVGQDLFGTGSFNARPALAPPAATGSNIVATSLGVFNALPTTAQSIIPPYSFDNPGQFAMNLRLSKTISFGKEAQGRGAAGKGGSLGAPRSTGSSGGGAPGTSRHPSLTLSITAINLFNNVNLGPRVGVLGSPLFGRSNSTVRIFDDVSQAANRRIDFQLVFTM